VDDNRRKHEDDTVEEDASPEEGCCGLPAVERHHEEELIQVWDERSPFLASDCPIELLVKNLPCWEWQEQRWSLKIAPPALSDRDPLLSKQQQQRLRRREGHVAAEVVWATLRHWPFRWVHSFLSFLLNILGKHCRWIVILRTTNSSALIDSKDSRLSRRATTV